MALRGVHLQILRPDVIRLIALGFVAAIVALLVGGAITPGRATTIRSRDVLVATRRFDTMVPRLLRRYGVPGASIALVEHGSVVWSHGYGWADRAGRRPVRPDSVFEVASMSKAVSAWGVLHLAESSGIDLDASVGRYLRRWRLPSSPANDGVTLRRLLTHTSGLVPVSYAGFPPSQRLPALTASLEGQGGDGPAVRIVREPGARFGYSDANYAVLQLMVEDTAKQPFATYMRDHVLLPLGMTSSTYDPARVPAGRMTVAYAPAGRALPATAFPEQAAEGLYTTAGDYARFLAAAWSDDRGAAPGRGVLTPAGAQLALSPAPRTGGADELGSAGQYGFGYLIESDDEGRSFVWHPGSNPGWATLVVGSPSRGDGLVVLTNSDAGNHLFFDVGCWWSRSVAGGDLPPCDALARGRTVVTVLTASVAFLLVLGAIAGLARPRRRSNAASLVKAGAVLAAVACWTSLWHSAALAHAIFHVDDLAAIAWMPPSFGYLTGVLVAAGLLFAGAKVAGGNARVRRHPGRRSTVLLVVSIFVQIAWWTDLFGRGVLATPGILPSKQWPHLSLIAIGFSLLLGATALRVATGSAARHAPTVDRSPPLVRASPGGSAP